MKRRPLRRRRGRSKRRRRARKRKSTSQRAQLVKTNQRARSAIKRLNRPGREQSQIGARKRERSKRKLKKLGKRKKKRSGSLRKRLKRKTRTVRQLRTLTSSLQTILTLSWRLTMHLCSHLFSLNRMILLLKISPLTIKKSKRVQEKTRRKTRRAERKIRRVRKGHVVEAGMITATEVMKTWSKQSSNKEARNSAK